MSEPLFTFTLAGRTYELASLTLGEMRTLKRQFGVTQMEDLNFTDPDHLTGLLYLARRRDGATPEAALAEVEALDINAFNTAAEELLAQAAEHAEETAGGNGKKASRRLEAKPKQHVDVI